MRYLKFLSIASTLILCSCNQDKLPKPASQLRLDYEEATYDRLSNSCNFSFESNKESTLKTNDSCGITLTYPKMKATIFLSYKQIKNNLNTLLIDAQKLTFEHVIKADDIIEQPFVNKNDRVYGMFYEVNGNAASQVQFYVTDSINHFVNCSVYFYAKPNFDSILPAADYIRKDVQHIMETFKWKK